MDEQQIGKLQEVAGIEDAWQEDLDCFRFHDSAEEAQDCRQEETENSFWAEEERCRVSWDDLQAPAAEDVFHELVHANQSALLEAQHAFLEQIEKMTDLGKVQIGRQRVPLKKKEVQESQRMHPLS